MSIRPRSAILGVTNDDIASSVRALISGDRATTFRQNGKDTDVVVRLKPGDRAGVDSHPRDRGADPGRQRATQLAGQGRADRRPDDHSPLRSTEPDADRRERSWPQCQRGAAGDRRPDLQGASLPSDIR